jgi:hypothetical protein
MTNYEYDSNVIGMEIQTIDCRKKSRNEDNEGKISFDHVVIERNDNMCPNSIHDSSCLQIPQEINHSPSSLCSDKLNIDDDDGDDVSAISIPNEFPIPHDVTDYIRNCITVLNDELSNVNERHEQYNQRFWKQMKEIEQQQHGMKAELERQQLRLNLEQQLLENELKSRKEQDDLKMAR